MELKPSIFAQVTEAIATADGSNRLGGVSKQWLLHHQRVPRSAHSPGDFRQAGRDCRLGTARFALRGHAVEGGYRITGKWRFMSGSQNATWLGAHLRVAGTKETKTFL